ncbi:MAG: NAD-dependent epimerase/dehydratase family protein [Clostridia bacterium]|nr:NAD-dependent epimerase/dehydratase family protein [Clostridia bacterium]
MFSDSKVYRDALTAAVPENIDGAIRGKTILVTGSTGLIGTVMIDALMQYGGCEKVIAGTRSRETAVKRFGEHMSNPGFSIAQYDLFKPFDLLEKCHYIIHLAANANPALYHTRPVDTLTGLIYGVDRLLMYCARRKGTRFVYLSSNEVYGQTDACPVCEDDMGRVDILSGRSCYPMGKRAAETLCACYHQQYGVNCVVARACHVYGPTMTASDNRAASQFLKDAVDGRDIVLQSDGSAVRSYMFVSDCVNGVLTAMAKGEVAGAYNVSSDAHSILEIATAIAEIAGVNVTIPEKASGEDRGYSPIARNIVSNDKLKALGWEPQYTLQKGIAASLDVMRGK